MRIRKRFLSLSSATHPPPSTTDLQGGRHHHQPPLPVQHQPQLHPHDNQRHRLLPPFSSDHTTQIGLQSIPSGDLKIESESEKKIESIKSDETDRRKDGILFAEVKNNHDLVMKGWLEGDGLVPTKKKRGSHGRRSMNDDDVVKDSTMIDRSLNPKKNNKNEKRECVIMEGSRCSRVNGRGWRCSQLTLVGYSLCEHHLGKGRLRTINKERKDKKTESLPVDIHDHEVEDDGEDDEDWDFERMSSSSMVGTKVFSKRTKVGVVKARSLSSLLSQISS